DDHIADGHHRQLLAFEFFFGRHVKNLVMQPTGRWTTRWERLPAENRAAFRRRTWGSLRLVLSFCLPPTYCLMFPFKKSAGPRNEGPAQDETFQI
ncbi:MAG TPA: hypothetical protein VF784_02745, partial [Anaerolineales bacterium]